MSKVGIGQVRDIISYLEDKIHVHRHSAIGAAEKERWCVEAESSVRRYLDELMQSEMTPQARRLTEIRLLEDVNGVANPKSLFSEVMSHVDMVRNSLVKEVQGQNIARDNVVYATFGTPGVDKSQQVAPESGVSNVSGIAKYMDSVAHERLSKLLNIDNEPNLVVPPDFGGVTAEMLGHGLFESDYSNDFETGYPQNKTQTPDESFRELWALLNTEPALTRVDPSLESILARNMEDSSIEHEMNSGPLLNSLQNKDKDSVELAAELSALLNADLGLSASDYSIKSAEHSDYLISRSSSDIAADNLNNEYQNTLTHNKSIEWIMPSIVAHLESVEADSSVDYANSQEYVSSGFDFELSEIKQFFKPSEDMIHVARQLVSDLYLCEKPISDLSRSEQAMACLLYASYETATEVMPTGATIGSKDYIEATKVFRSHLDKNNDLSNDLSL